MSAVRSEPVQKRATEKVALIEGIALEHLREVGVRAFSTAVVAERAGISVGSIYRYWADTEALIEAIAPGACRAWEAMQPEWQVSYSDPSAPSVDGYRLRRAMTFTDRASAVEFARTALNPKLHSRSRGVDPGEWTPVELPKALSS